MSSTFDTMQQALATLEGDRQVKANLRFCIDHLHEYDHKHEGALNRWAGASATLLEKVLTAALAKKERGT